LKLKYISFLIFGIAVFLVFYLETIFPFASEAYWVDHFLYGFGFPWFFAYLPMVFMWDRSKFSFKHGVYIAIAISLANEYIADVIDNKVWVFSEQIVHTAADFTGILIAIALFLLMTKFMGIKA